MRKLAGLLWTRDLGNERRPQILWYDMSYFTSQFIGTLNQIVSSKGPVAVNLKVVQSRIRSNKMRGVDLKQL